MSDWRNNLNGFFDKAEQKTQKEVTSDFNTFISDTVVSAFDQLAEELRQHGREVTIRTADSSAAIIVLHRGEEEMTYRIQGRTFPTGFLPYAEVRFRQRKGLKLITVESMFRSGIPNYQTRDITSDEIISHFLENYMQRVKPGA